MQTAADAATVDLTRTRARLLDGVTFTPQVYGSEFYYHVQSPGQTAWYRIGATEYVFLSLMDGTCSFCEALAKTARTLGAEALPQESALSLYRWGIENRIVGLQEADTPERMSAEKKSQAAFWQKLNPLWIRVPFGRPDALLQALEPVLGWLFSPVASFVAVCMMAAAGAQLASDWEKFSADSANVFATSNWMWLAAAWVLLKVIHESAHGLVCRRYGGEVAETGVILAFFAPLAYVDVTSCWAFRSRWQRIHTAAAGMYVELLVASIAVFVWTFSQSAVLSHLMYNLIVMASLSTILFNANPLMRFDGYYILSDLLQIPNLYNLSSDETRSAVGYLLFGKTRTSPKVVGRRRVILLLYGVAAFVWRIFICVTMVIAASVLFQGAGIVLSALAVLAWFAVPVFSVARRGIQIAALSPVRAVRGFVLAGTIILLFVAVTAYCPLPFGNAAPGIVCLPDGATVRTNVDGFVEDVHVQEGDEVVEGDLLITLRNDEVSLNERDLLLQIQQETIRHQAALKEHDAAAARIAEGNLDSLREQLFEAETRAESLLIRATHNGRVIGRQLKQMRGSFVKEGQELLFVDDGKQRELRVSVAQEDFSVVESLQSTATTIRIGSRPACTGALSRTIPRASRRLAQPALAASEGGMLPVMESKGDDGQSTPELTEQRFSAVFKIESAQLYPAVGERGYVALPGSHDCLAEWVYFRLRQWLQDQIKAAGQSSA